MITNDILNKGLSCEWVFSDFFDTLIHRNISETEVKKIWANRVAEHIQYAINPFDIYNHRIQAPKKILSNKSHTEEITYNEIIHEIYTSFHNELCNYTEKEFFKICFDLELNTEGKVLYRDDDMYNLLCELKNNNVKIAIISDCVLPSSAIEYYLNLLNMSNLADIIFVSSDYGVRKRSGKLYDVVKKATKCGHNALMIGDNQKSDVEKSAQAGFYSYLWDNKNATTTSTKNLFDSLKQIFNSNKHNSFANYSFLFFYFIDNLYKKLIKSGCKSVCFMSREGYFLKELFDEYQLYKDIKIDTKYICVSRKSTLLASIKRADGNFCFDGIFNSYSKLDIISFLKNLSFSDSEIDVVLANYPYNKSEMINNFPQSQSFEWLINQFAFIDLLNKKYNTANSVFNDYINVLLPKNSKDLWLVDVGWKGTIQDNIFYALKEKYTVHGFYLGLENITLCECCNNTKEGILFSCIPSKSNRYELFDFETHLIEQLLAAPHGSTACYEKLNESDVKPVFENYTKNEKELYENTKPIQDCIKQEFIQLTEIFNTNIDDNNANLKMIKYIAKAELCLNKSCIQYEKIALTPATNNFGWFDKIPTRTSKKDKLLSLLQDLKNIYKSNASFMGYVNYFAIKMNARHKFDWKIVIYRIVYFIDTIKLFRSK